MGSRFGAGLGASRPSKSSGWSVAKSAKTAPQPRGVSWRISSPSILREGTEPSYNLDVSRARLGMAPPRSGSANRAWSADPSFMKSGRRLARRPWP